MQGEWHGHPKFYNNLVADAQLHSSKNYDYAHGGDPLGNFKRVSTILSLYPKFPLHHPAAVAFVYMIKQIDAIGWLMSQGHEAKHEGVEKRAQDISVYSNIMRCIFSEMGDDRIPMGE